MKIRINDLPEAGLSVQEKILPDGINQRLQDGEDTQFLFTAPLEVSATITPLGGSGAQVKGTVKGCYNQDCSLCLQAITRTVNTPLAFQLRRQNDEGTIEDDVGISVFSGDHAELEPIIEEEVLLTLSLFWHPPMIEGRCTECHKTRKSLGLEEEPKKATLGDLLKKASN